MGRVTDVPRSDVGIDGLQFAVDRGMTPTEADFLRMARKKSFRVFRGGWPDFLLLDEQKRPMFVEVKRGVDRLRPEQLEMMAALSSAGIRCFVWWDRRPSALIHWSKFDATQERELAEASRAALMKRQRAAARKRRSRHPGLNDPANF